MRGENRDDRRTFRTVKKNVIKQDTTMIDNLKISYELDKDISVALSTETGYDDNLPHNLAAVFAKVIKDSNANADMVIENLKMDLDYE